MKAIVQHRYGTPDVLVLADIEAPSVDDDGVLVEVHAASVNALDWHATRGMPYLIRLDEGLRAPRHRVRGVDLSGRVVAVGRNVERFAPGDDVFGGSNGSFAELTVTTADRLAAKPAAFTYEQAAALHIGGLTALQGLREKARVERGQRVLINGAGGGVGTFAVQIARWLGAHVTAVTRTESVDIVRSVGAHDVIDHRVEDFTRRRGGERYDAIFDIGGNRPFAHLRRVLTRNGEIVAVGAPAGRWLAPATRMAKAALLSPFVSQRLVPFLSRNDAASLAVVAELAETGHIVPVIDRVYPLDEAAEAVRYVGEGRARGKVGVRVR
jgi:NADPH:quinone reductase-like Zn-dependent oxidoreductase